MRKYKILTGRAIRTKMDQAGPCKYYTYTGGVVFPFETIA